MLLTLSILLLTLVSADNYAVILSAGNSRSDNVLTSECCYLFHSLLKSGMEKSKIALLVPPKAFSGKNSPPNEVPDRSYEWYCQDHVDYAERPRTKLLFRHIIRGDKVDGVPSLFTFNSGDSLTIFMNLRGSNGVYQMDHELLSQDELIDMLKQAKLIRGLSFILVFINSPFLEDNTLGDSGIYIVSMTTPSHHLVYNCLNTLQIPDVPKATTSDLCEGSGYFIGLAQKLLSFRSLTSIESQVPTSPFLMDQEYSRRYYSGFDISGTWPNNEMEYFLAMYNLYSAESTDASVVKPLVEELRGIVRTRNKHSVEIMRIARMVIQDEVVIDRGMAHYAENAVSECVSNVQDFLMDKCLWTIPFATVHVNLITHICDKGRNVDVSKFDSSQVCIGKDQ